MRLDRQLLGLDLYAVLQVPETAGRDRIRAAYRQLAVRYHPDRNPRDRFAAELRMAELNVAASVLLDPPRRVAYDRARDAQRRRHETRRSRDPGPSAARDPSGASSAWWSRPDDDETEWVEARPAPPVPPPKDETGELIERMRPRVTRMLAAFAGEVTSWSARRHAALLAVCVLSAIELIAQAEPRSLGYRESGEPPVASEVR